MPWRGRCSFAVTAVQDGLPSKGHPLRPNRNRKFLTGKGYEQDGVGMPTHRTRQRGPEQGPIPRSPVGRDGRDRDERRRAAKGHTEKWGQKRDEDAGSVYHQEDKRSVSDTGDSGGRSLRVDVEAATSRRHICRDTPPGESWVWLFARGRRSAEKRNDLRLNEFKW